MTIKPIKTKKDYQLAINRLESFLMPSPELLMVMSWRSWVF